MGIGCSLFGTCVLLASQETIMTGKSRLWGLHDIESSTFWLVLFQGHSLAPVSFWYPLSGKMHVWLWLHAVGAAHMIASGLWPIRDRQQAWSNWEA
ncbi:predicted protein [Lichtheimia corymbifera JMRC:FSU:9682]|uniref:Uncharacterized protein n=1 Tax=Lichtheimia corymbifera JMRC:FSU:9682 TaxID=1263082 RepID=A0A068RNC4_9FUNG|nr:predicted protein [Lichtheimia corymbifera JMRC:FSU:9682]